MGGRDHSCERCERCGRGGLNDHYGGCECVTLIRWEGRESWSHLVHPDVRVVEDLRRAGYEVWDFAPVEDCERGRCLTCGSDDPAASDPHAALRERLIELRDRNPYNGPVSALSQADRDTLAEAVNALTPEEAR